jgi:23S rRNA (adenine2030-N6)-methyltransferase
MADCSACMNYRHAFHAGNFADVLKHAALLLALERLKLKEKGFFVLDAQAGRGAYDLGADQARRTGEAADGVLRVLAAADPPAALAPYLAALRAFDPADPPARYPGSPRLIRMALRPQDRLVANELHPEDAAALAAEFADDRQVKARHEDAYALLKSALPPPERRGLVLLDPPYEAADEFARLAAGLEQAHRRWATGIYLLWRPIKARGPAHAFHGALLESGVRRILTAELLVEPPDDPARLSGCGLEIVNPPWGLEDSLRELLPWLARTLSRRGGDWRLEWLAGE